MIGSTPSEFRPFRLGAALDRAPQDFGLPRGLFVAINVAAIALLATFAVLLALRDTHRATFNLIAENGPVENSTFACFLVAGVLGLLLAREAPRLAQPKRVGYFYAGFGVLSLVSAMEEISWGQSWFDYPTPWGLRDVNVQGELNVHNLPGAMDLNLVVLLGFGVLLLVGIALGRRAAWRPVAVPTVLLPIAITITVAGLVQVIAEQFLTLFSFDMVVTSLSEVVELLMGIACVMYVWLSRRRLRREVE